MPQWTESQYTERATAIARQFFAERIPLNDLSEKVARDENMQPDEIRTLVRLANVAAFQQLFKHKDDGDKVVDFETGDPEAVIMRIIQSAQPSQSANVHNDKLAQWRAPDDMRLRRGGGNAEETSTHKVAETAQSTARVDLEILAARKLASEISVLRYQAEQRWDAALTKLAHTWRGVYKIAEFDTFQNQALAAYGADIWPEVYALRTHLRLPPQDQPPREKIATLQQHEAAVSSPELSLLSNARDARALYDRCTLGQQWLTKNTPAAGSF